VDDLDGGLTAATGFGGSTFTWTFACPSEDDESDDND